MCFKLKENLLKARFFAVTYENSSKSLSKSNNMEITYAASFLRKFKNLEEELGDEIVEKTALFRSRANHRTLKVHKLHGELSNYLSFSVNYRVRIVFRWITKNNAFFTAIGDHDVYK